MRRGVRWLVPSAILLLGPALPRAQWAVHDAPNYVQMTAAVKALGDQLTKMQATYNALSGTRGLGDIAYDPALREFLPADWARVYDAALTGAYAGISGPLAAIRAAEELHGTVAEVQASIAARGRSSAATDKAVGLRAFDGARARLAQIEKLMGRINQTRDQKGIQELQARIAVEQAAVQNEGTKLQLVGMLQRAEERLVEQQKSDLAQRILSSSNTGMPPCCSSRVQR